MGKIARRKFDYESASDAKSCEMSKSIIIGHAVDATKHLLLMGEELANVQRRLKGRFAEWVAVEVGFSYSKATNFIRGAKFLASLADIPPERFDLTSVYVASRKSTPQSAKDEIVQRARSGELITSSKTNEIVGRHQEHYAPFRAGKGSPAAGDSGVKVTSGSQGSVGGQLVKVTSQKDDSVRNQSVIFTTAERVEDVPSVAEIIAQISKLEAMLNAYAASDQGREVAVDKATKAIKDLRSAVVGGGTAQVIADDVTIPESIDTKEVRKSLNQWLLYKRKRNQPYKDAGQVALQMKRWGGKPPQSFVAAVEYSIAQNYQGITPDKEHEHGRGTTGKSVSDYAAWANEDAA